jgi:hypothetical protein
MGENYAIKDWGQAAAGAIPSRRPLFEPGEMLGFGTMGDSTEPQTDAAIHPYHQALLAAHGQNTLAAPVPMAPAVPGPAHGAPVAPMPFAPGEGTGPPTIAAPHFAGQGGGIQELGAAPAGPGAWNNAPGGPKVTAAPAAPAAPTLGPNATHWDATQRLRQSLWDRVHAATDPTEQANALAAFNAMHYQGVGAAQQELARQQSARMAAEEGQAKNNLLSQQANAKAMLQDRSARAAYLAQSGMTPEQIQAFDSMFPTGGPTQAPKGKPSKLDIPALLKGQYSDMGDLLDPSHPSYHKSGYASERVADAMQRGVFDEGAASPRALAFAQGLRRLYPDDELQSDLAANIDPSVNPRPTMLGRDIHSLWLQLTQGDWQKRLRGRQTLADILGAATAQDYLPADGGGIMGALQVPPAQAPTFGR